MPNVLVAAYNCKLGRPMPKTRSRFWKSKFERNKQRDAQNYPSCPKNGFPLELHLAALRAQQRVYQRIIIYTNPGASKLIHDAPTRFELRDLQSRRRDQSKVIENRSVAHISLR